MMNSIVIDSVEIGAGNKPYIIAELSANHNGSIERAFESISVAKAMGADAVKIQTYTPDTMTIDSSQEGFVINGGLWDGYNLYELYKEAHTPFEWHADLFAHAKKIGITLFSSPFDETAIALLEGLNAPAYKVASFELVDIPLIQALADTNKPLIMSTGMANFEEIGEAVEAAKSGGCKEIILLHCISGYPVPVDQANLLSIPLLKKEFGCLVGLSDHTLGTSVSVAAAALGASVIEKHFTLDRADKGPDSEFSLEPSELKTLCEDTQSAWQALGVANSERSEIESTNRQFRRSLYFVEDLSAGEVVEKKHVRRIRPGFGIAPKYFDDVMGCVVTKNITRGTPVSWDCIRNESADVVSND